MIRDTRMMSRAIVQRWPMSEEVRRQVLEKLAEIVIDPESKNREVIAAAKALMSAEAQNQSDEHKVLDVQLQHSNDRLSQIASELGIDASVIYDAERASGRRLEGVSDAPADDIERQGHSEETGEAVGSGAGDDPGTGEPD